MQLKLEADIFHNLLSKAIVWMCVQCIQFLKYIQENRQYVNL